MTQENKEVTSLLLQTYKDIRHLLMIAPNRIQGIKELDFGLVNTNFGIRFIEIASPDFVLSNNSDRLQIYCLTAPEWPHTRLLTNYFNSIGMAYVCYCKYPGLLYFLLRVKTYLEEIVHV